jgi:hypothetical protein
MQISNTLFVYYKIPVQQHLQTLLLLHNLVRTLKALYTGLEIEIMQRPEVSGDQIETWMEVYRYPTGITPEMMEKITAHAQESGLPLARKAEIFIPLA